MLGDRIRETRSIAKRYDRLNPYGKSLVSPVINHEAARIAASEPDDLKSPDMQSTRLTLLRRNDRNQQANLCAGLRIQILIERLGARIIGRAGVRQYGQVDGLAAENVSHVLNLLSGYTILYAGA